MNADEESQRFDAVKYLKYSGAGAIPRGVEVLLKKAAVDPKFRKTLLEKRAAAASEINLALTDVERTLLSNIPADQLEKIIANTKVPPEHREVFLGTVGNLMLALVAGAVIASLFTPTFGHTGRLEFIRRQIEQERVRAMMETDEANEPNRAGVRDSNDETRPQ